MTRICSFCLLAFTGLLLSASPASADILIRAPFVSIAIGQPCNPNSPGIDVNVPFFQLHIDKKRAPAFPPYPTPVPPSTPGPEKLPPPKPVAPSSQAVPGAEYAC